MCQQLNNNSHQRADNMHANPIREPTYPTPVAMPCTIPVDTREPLPPTLRPISQKTQCNTYEGATNIFTIITEGTCRSLTTLSDAKSQVFAPVIVIPISRNTMEHMNLIRISTPRSYGNAQHPKNLGASWQGSNEEKWQTWCDSSAEEKFPKIGKSHMQNMCVTISQTKIPNVYQHLTRQERISRRGSNTTSWHHYYQVHLKQQYFNKKAVASPWPISKSST